MTRRVTIWDPVIRIGHWIIVGGFVTAYLTEDDVLALHVWAGYVVGLVVAFRILWGFIGPQSARFSDFLYTPRTVVAYLGDLVRFRAKRYIGHSPAGGMMVLALLTMLAGTVVTGLMTYGADRRAGPLGPLYSDGASTATYLSVIGAAQAEEHAAAPVAGERDGGNEDSALQELHGLFANFTLVLVLLHVAGVTLASIAHRENLVAAMVTGRKRVEDHPHGVRRGPVFGR